MDITAIEKNFSQKVAEEIRLVARGDERYAVLTPFMFDDGDHLAITLKRRDGKWEISDGGHTYMHLSYDIDHAAMFKGTRGEIIANTLEMFHVNDRDGELVVDVKDDGYGEALFTLVQALLRIAEAARPSKRSSRRTFRTDFRNLMTETVPHKRMKVNWHDPYRDDSGKYRVGYRINGMSHPLFVYALHNDARTEEATIALHQFLKWGIKFEPVCVFEDVHAIGGKVLGRFSDVCPSENQFAKFSEERGRVAEFLHDAMSYDAAD